MTFNIKKAVALAQKGAENRNLSLLVMGASGAGKSGLLGTSGLKSLYIHTNREKHGPISATMFGENVLPLDISYNDEGQLLTADQSYEYLLEVLADHKQLKEAGIQLIALDGATEIETVITATTAWKKRVVDAYKGVESFAGPVTLAMFKPIYDSLVAFQRELNGHYVMTCILNVKEAGDNLAILDAEPKLKGFDVASSIVQMFDDIVVIGQLINPNNGKPSPRIQLSASVSKSTKDFKTKEVRKTANFTPRLTGVDLSDAPATLPPDLSRLIEFKKVGKYVAKTKE